MAEITRIAWAHSTFNPWIGRDKDKGGDLLQGQRYQQFPRAA